MRLIIHTRTSKNIFLIDALGALVSAFFLLVILKNFSTRFGMPESILNVLSAIALALFVFSTSCYLLLKTNWRFFLKITATANLAYCCATLGLAIYYFTTLTIFGIVYFTIEIIIIVLLAIFEFKIAGLKSNAR